MATMNVSLPPHLEKLVLDRVNSGHYTSASGGAPRSAPMPVSPFDEVTVKPVKQAGRAELKLAKGAGG